MTETADITACVARLERLLDSRLGLARGPLAQRVAKVGRRVPLSVRRYLGQVAQAAEMVTHPKLGLRVDHAAVLAAGARAEAYLKAIDAADRRRGRLLGMLGALVFNLLLFAVLLVIVLRWRGLV